MSMSSLNDLSFFWQIMAFALHPVRKGCTFHPQKTPISHEKNF